MIAMICQEYQDDIAALVNDPDVIAMSMTITLEQTHETNFMLPACREYTRRTGRHTTHMGAVQAALQQIKANEVSA